MNFHLMYNPLIGIKQYSYPMPSYRQNHNPFRQWVSFPINPNQKVSPFSFHGGNMNPQINQASVPAHTNPFYLWLENPLHPIYQSDPYTGFLSGFGFPPPERPNNLTATLINSFKNKDGSLDVNKMLATAGQLIGTIDQLAGTYKGVSSLFKN